jgi:hypothetical protein
MRFGRSILGHRKPETRIQPSDNTSSNPALFAKSTSGEVQSDPGIKTLLGGKFVSATFPPDALLVAVYLALLL